MTTIIIKSKNKLKNVQIAKKLKCFLAFILEF